MNVAIVIHSQTGNTRTVAERLREALVAKGHAASIIEVRLAAESKPGDRNAKLASVPDVSGYDALAFGSPVHGFSLSPAMTSYLKQAPSFKGKRAACFVTQGLRFTWLGGNRTIGQMKRACEAKGAKVCGTGVVGWGRKDREKQIADLVATLAKSLCE